MTNPPSANPKPPSKRADKPPRRLATGPVNYWQLPPRKVFGFIFSGIWFLLRRPSLWIYAIAPILINLALFSAAMWATYQFIATPSSSALVSWFGLEEGFLSSSIAFLFMLPFMIGGLFVGYVILGPLSSPFIDLLTEQIERELLRYRKHLLPPSQPVMAAMRHALFEAFQRLILVLPFVGVSLVCGCVPILGPPIILLTGFTSAMIFLPIDSFSYSMDRRKIPLRKKWELLKSNKRVWLPFGLSQALLVLIPFNVIFLPLLGGIAATRLFCAHILAADLESADLSARSGSSR